MKQIFKNQYLKSVCFNSSGELIDYLGKIKVQSQVDLNDTFGDYHYCYLFVNSLTQVNEFCITFSTDETEENLSILFWSEKNLLILNSGARIHFVSWLARIIASVEISSPLVGLQLLNNKKLLILEETTLRVVGSDGNIEQEQLFDLMTNFRLEGSKLTVITDENTQVYLLD